MSYTLLDLLSDIHDPSGFDLTEHDEKKVYDFVYKKAADRLEVEGEEFAQAHAMNFENDPEYVQGYYNGLLQAARLLRMAVDE